MKTCMTCRWASIAGGDIVPYGSSTAVLPEYPEDCTNVTATLNMSDREYEAVINDEKECRFWEEREDEAC